MAPGGSGPVAAVALRAEIGLRAVAAFEYETAGGGGRDAWPLIALVSWARPARLVRGLVLESLGAWLRGGSGGGWRVPDFRIFLKARSTRNVGAWLAVQALVLFPPLRAGAEVTLPSWDWGGRAGAELGGLILGLKQGLSAGPNNGGACYRSV